MRRFRLPHRTQLTESSLRALYQHLRADLAEARTTSLWEILRGVQDALERFFARLGRPLYRHRDFEDEDALDAVRLHHVTREISTDLGTLHQEAESLREMTVATHNHAALRTGELRLRASQVAGLVTDLELLSGQKASEVLVFSDRFDDASRIDASFGGEHARADVMAGYGGLTLKRLGSSTVQSGEATVSVRVLSPAGAGREPTLDGTRRVYEGHFHALLGEAEPEGGVLHLVEEIDDEALRRYSQAATRAPEDTNEDGKISRKESRNYAVPGGKEALFLEQVSSGVFADKSPKKLSRFVGRKRDKLHKKDRALRRSAIYFQQHPEEGVAPSSDVPLSPENLVVMEAGADEDGLQAMRQQMLDGNPASYWQCEWSERTGVLEALLDEQEGLSEVEVAELMEAARSSEVDTLDFEIEIVVTLNQPQVLNWITLQPMMFDPGAFLEVTDVSVSTGDDEGFVAVESFADGSTPRVLTEDANLEVSSQAARQTLVSGRDAYRGVGVWPFSGREVRAVRIRLRQPTPTPSPYERYVIEATRSVTTRGRGRRGA